jgi:TPR repeat protein
MFYDSCAVGHGVEVDEKAAAEWYRKGADDADSPDAQSNLSLW